MLNYTRSLMMFGGLLCHVTTDLNPHRCVPQEDGLGTNTTVSNRGLFPCTAIELPLSTGWGGSELCMLWIHLTARRHKETRRHFRYGNVMKFTAPVVFYEI